MPPEGVVPLRTVQSNWSEVDWDQPAHRPLSKAHFIALTGRKKKKIYIY